MIPRKLAEVIFQRLWLLAVPLIAAPVLAFFLVDHPEEYRSDSSVWVSSFDGADGGAGFLFEDVSVAETWAGTLNELLTTRTFRDGVAQRAFAPSGDELELASAIVADSVSVEAAGDNLVQIHAYGATSGDAYQLNVAVIEQYRAFSTEGIYESAVDDLTAAQAALDRAAAELAVRRDEAAAWLVSNPKATTGTDPSYAELVARVVAQSQTVDELTNDVFELTVVADAAEQGTLTELDVIDEPNLPDSTVAIPLTDRLMPPVAGLALGLTIAAVVILIGFRTDHTIRSSEDLEGLSVPLLGHVPELKSPLRNLLRSDPYGHGVAASLALPPARPQEDNS